MSWVWPEEEGVKAQAKRMKAERDDKVKAYVVETNHYRYWDHWMLRGRMPHIHVATLPTTTLAAGVTGAATVRDLFEGTTFHLPPQEPDANLFDISPRRQGDRVHARFRSRSARRRRSPTSS